MAGSWLSRGEGGAEVYVRLRGWTALGEVDVVMMASTGNWRNGLIGLVA